MLKILWEREAIAPEEQYLLLSKIFYYLMLDFYVKTGIRFSLRDKRLFEITEVEITRVDYIYEIAMIRKRSHMERNTIKRHTKKNMMNEKQLFFKQTDQDCPKTSM